MRRVTVPLDDEALYAALQAEAARRGTPVKELVAEAIGDWLEAQGDFSLITGLDAARKEWQEQGGVEAGAFFRELRQSESEPGAL